MNMLAVIKQKALQMELISAGGAGAVEEAAEEAAGPAASGDDGEAAAAHAAAGEGDREAGEGEEEAEGTDSALYKAILAKARVLKPASAELKEVSVDGDGRPCYELTVAAACFDGLADEKRQQLAMTVLRKEAGQAGDLVVIAKTPDEAGI
jgi:acid stress-induced BolA-like protein IbaG/YrbA